MSSNDKVALVTGAGRGLGRALTTGLLARGWQVIACMRNPVAAALPAHPGLRAKVLDQGDPASVAALAASLAGQRLDLILHNAAIRGDTNGLPGFTAADFLQGMQVNVGGPLMLTQALIGQMPVDGRIAFISSRAGSMAEGRDPDGDYAYCASKAALNRLVVKLADDYPQTLLALHPGWVRTDMGGQGAEVDATDSAAALLDLIERAGPKDTGSFRAYDGSKVGW